MRCGTFKTFWAAPTQWQASSTSYTFLELGPEVGSCTPGQLVAVTQSEWSATTASITVSSGSVSPSTVTDYDYATGAAFWAFGFTGVMISYFSAHLVGLVLRFVRGG